MHDAETHSWVHANRSSTTRAGKKIELFEHSSIDSDAMLETGEFPGGMTAYLRDALVRSRWTASCGIEDFGLSLVCSPTRPAITWLQFKSAKESSRLL